MTNLSAPVLATVDGELQLNDNSALDALSLPNLTSVTARLSFTINAALPQLTLPRANADAEANVFSTNLNLVSRPVDDWRFSARVRRYDYSNQMPHTAIPQFIKGRPNSALWVLC